MLKETRPGIDDEGATRLLQESFELDVRALTPLPSERDQNFLVATPDEKLVLKIANAAEERNVLELQNRALEHVHVRDAELRIPKLRRGRDGETIYELSGGHLCRLLTYLPGKPLAKTTPHTPAMLRSLGRFMGRLDRALAGLQHEAQDRYLYWDSRHAVETIGNDIELVRLIEDETRRRRVATWRSRYEADVAPALASLPTGAIHNDGNDHNVLVEEGQVTGLLDFGDMVSSALVFEVANASMYCMLGKDDPLTAATHVVRGYHEERPLADEELAVLFTAIGTRLAMSIAVAARQTRDEPDQEYLRVSQASAEALLEALDGVCPRFAHYAFRDACGKTPHPRGEAVTGWLRHQTTDVLPFPIENPHVLDLSVGSTELGGLDVLDDVERFAAHVFDTMRAHGAAVGVGRYNEPRRLYTSEAFQPKPGEHFEPRTLHVGIDLFVEAGTPIRAPFDGRVHSFANHEAPLDYGPTILLEHETDDGDPFWTLYGHLSSRSLEGLEVGQAVARSNVLATVGDFPTNGNWPPHLHFQLILDMLDMEGDFPGVVPPSKRSLWLGICPDPSGVLAIENAVAGDPNDTRARIRERRSDHLSETLSVSYDEPLHIVRGYGAFLYDSDARPYLDMVNNVCHVGHARPSVVKAAREQIAVLNTNTRYLHPNIVDYAERLTATLPDPLEVCFFVNSGSEANDLALRLARTHTGRKDTLVLAGAYHGNLSSLIEISPYKFDGIGGRGAPHFVHVLEMPDGFRGRHRSSDAGFGDAYVRDARAAIDRLADRGQPIGTFIAESILSCGGQIVLPPDYLNGVYGLVREAGGVCIADEVQVGFGRVGSHFWAFEAEGVVPDIVTMGKPIGNGHPLAAVVTTRAIAESFQTGMEYFNTFGGNPVSCAVGLAVLDAIEGESLQQNAADVGALLASGLRTIAAEHAIIGDVRGRGLFLGFELVRDEELTPARDEAAYLVNRMKEQGVLSNTDGPLANVIKLKPPLVFSGANAEFFLDRLENVLKDDKLQR